MPVQTSYSQLPASSRKGTLADGDAHSRQVSPGVSDSSAPRVGNLCSITGRTQGSVAPATVAALAALAVDVDAIVTTRATAASKDILTTTELNGVVGQGVMNPARRITFIADSHANWDASRVVIAGEDANGNPISETLLMPDAGAVTLTTSQFFSRIVSIEIDAQAGTGGTYTVGITADEGIYKKGTVGVPIREMSRSPLSSSDAFAQYDEVSLLIKGKIIVAVEAAITDLKQKVYVRTATSGGDVMGQWSGAAGTGFAELPWARWGDLSDGDSLVELVLGE